MDKCPIMNLEDAIRKKFVNIGRALSPPKDRPHAPPPEKVAPVKPAISLPKGFAEFSYAQAANLSPSPPHGSLSPGSPEHGPAPLASLKVKPLQSVSFGQNADGTGTDAGAGPGPGLGLVAGVEASVGESAPYYSVLAN